MTTAALSKTGLAINDKILDLPETVLKNQEINDVKALEKLLTEFLRPLKKDKLILTLAPDYIYEKNILQTDVADEAFEREKFLSAIPFDPPKLAVKVVKTDLDVTFYAANKSLFFPFVRVFMKLGWEPAAVTPEANLETDFLAELAPKQPSRFSSKLIGLGLFFTIALFCGLGIFAYRFFNPPSPTISSQNPKSPVASPTAQTTPPAMTYKALQDIRARVLNGTGIEGDAGKIAKIMESLGFKNVQTGNKDVQNHLETLLLYNENINPALISSLAATLKIATPASFATPAASFDLEIITGRL